MRKLFLFFVALLASTSLWAQSVGYTFTNGDWSFCITSMIDKTVDVSGVTPGHLVVTSNPTIPTKAQLNGYGTFTVTGIKESAFSANKNSLYAEYLTAITIPNTITSIGHNAFYCCSSLKSITIPNSVTTIGGSAFAGCTSLVSVSISESLKSINASVFSACSSLTSITIPNNVTSIAASAFAACSSLTSVSLNEDLVAIGEKAFINCSSITSITLPHNVKSIGNSAFKNCSALSSIVLGDSINSIGENTFSNCSSINSIVIPESVTFIGKDAFSGCYFKSDNFINYSSCTSSNYWGAILYDNEVNGLIIKDNTVIKCRPYVISAIIPEDVTSIGNSAFSGCTNLTFVTIPNSVTNIGNSGFNKCSGLTTISIPNSVTTIGDYVFNGCTSLTSIVISNNITTISDYAFKDCTSLTSIIIPNSVTSIGYDAFYGCSSLSSITIPESVISIESTSFKATAWYAGLPNGVVYINKILYLYKGTMPRDTSIEIKEGTINITSSAFYNQSGLKSVKIPNSVTSIGAAAFRKCTALTSLTIPENVAEIGDYAFYECSALKTIYALPMTPPELGGYLNFDSKYIKNIIVSLSSFVDYKKQWVSYSDFITTEIDENISLSLLNCTQKTISLHAEVSDLSDSIKMGRHAVEWCVGETITSGANKIYFDEGMLNLDTTITNLSPNTQYAFRVLYGIQDETGVTYYINGDTRKFTTSSVVLYEPTLQTTGQTYIEVQTSSAYGDATLVEEVVEVATSKYNTPEQRVNVAGRSNVIINNLMPDTKYYFRSVLTTQEAGTMQSEWYEATTEEITLATGDADGISNSSAFLHGTIDCDTMSRTEIGFEWKRSDAPSTVKPQRLLVVDRVDENLIFRLEGLSSDRYYDFRTFCLYNGKEYYGEWVGFLTSDKDILIPPSVQTREAEITELGALMKGFVVAGTEVILQRGFECWREGSDQVATTVAEGAVMSSYIPEAWSYTTYKYRAYAKTPAGTTYGETLEVTTEYIATNIADIIVNASSNSAQVTWTMVEQADYYILTLYSDESMTEVIGVYTVDKNGNVTQKRVASATQSLVTCELTELLPGTNYYFAVKAYNSDDQMVAEENGSFATTVVPTYVENTNTQSPMTDCQKIIRNGQLLILRDGKTYTIMGAQIQ